jgi:hypothetical protein
MPSSGDKTVSATLPPPRGGWRLAIAWALLLLASGEMVVRGPFRAVAGGSGGLEPSQDFALYYCSARAMMSGTDPYDLANLRQIARQTGAPAALLAYAIAPPVSLVPLAPLAELDWKPAKAIWMVLNVLLTSALIVFLAGLCEVPLAWRETRGVLLAALVVGMAPLQTCIGLGQLAVASAACAVGAMYSRQRGKPWHAGAMLGLAACLKPQMAAIFLLYWLVRGRWKGLAVAAAVGLVAAAFCVVKLAGAYPAFVESWRANLHMAVDGGIADYANPGQQHNLINLQYPLYRLTGSRSIAEILPWVFAAGVLAPALWIWRRRTGRPDELLMLSLLAVVGLLPIYHVWYDAVLLAVPLCWALSALGQPAARRWAWATILLILPFLVPGPAILSRWGPDHLPASVWSSWWLQAIVMPYQAYLAAALAIVLLAVMISGWRARARALP